MNSSKYKKRKCSKFKDTLGPDYWSHTRGWGLCTELHGGFVVSQFCQINRRANVVAHDAFWTHSWILHQPLLLLVCSYRLSLCVLRVSIKSMFGFPVRLLAVSIHTLIPQGVGSFFQSNRRVKTSRGHQPGYRVSSAVNSRIKSSVIDKNSRSH